MSNTDQNQLRDQLLAEQTFAAALLGNALGALGAALVYAGIWLLSIIPIILLIVPGIVAGYIARYTGKAFELKYRAAGALVILVLLWLLPWIIGGPWYLQFLALPNAIVAIALSRRKLTHEQERALFLYRMGIDKPSSGSAYSG